MGIPLGYVSVSDLYITLRGYEYFHDMMADGRLDDVVQQLRNKDHKILIQQLLLMKTALPQSHAYREEKSFTNDISHKEEVWWN
jgi:hypothetical protein